MIAIDSMAKKIRQSFDAAAHTYDGAAALQRQVGFDFISMFDINIARQCVIDLGCGTGFLMQQLMSDVAVRQMIAVDIAHAMLQVSRSKLQHLSNIQFVCADAEKLPVANHSMDTIVSNLALQWCRNLPAVFVNFRQVLKPGGRLLFSTFGAKTLQELKQSWAQVDNYAHVNDFYTVDELTRFLQQAGFKDIRIESKCYHSGYPSVIALMKELKGIGANQVMSGRKQKTIGRMQMQAMTDSYETYRVNGLIPATYEVLFISATR
ncbi:MAG: malonyl-ACP O-methyltransferase BioC [Methylococcales bacterium]|jgi:malonyl-CoA O-methyltransferase